MYRTFKPLKTNIMTAIFLSDVDSVQRLTAKITELLAIQENMKAANKIIKSTKNTEMQKAALLIAMGFTSSNAAKLLSPDFAGRTGFPSYKLTNNNAGIKAAQEQLAKAIKLKTTEDKDYIIGFVSVCENSTENRLQLTFDGKPDEAVRAELKHNGFRWSPTNGCWQSYMNSHQVRRAKEIIEEMEA